MAFNLDDIIIDRVQYGVAENSAGELLYVLTQLTDATISITAESKDAVDSTGTLVKRFWQGKTGEFSASNAMVNLNILAAESGSEKTLGTAAAKIDMPKMAVVKAGQTLTVNNYKNDGSMRVYALGNNGALGDEFELGQAASATAYTFASGTLTPPTAEGVDQYFVKYNRSEENAISMINRADKFPSTVKLTLKALCVDPCEADVLRACYIILPSFQVSPECEITLDTESTMDFNGTLQVDYCSADKVLYQIVMAEDDEEE